MIVKKKEVNFDDKKRKESSMMVSQKDDEGSKLSYEESDVEEELYNLMRGHTSLMITEDSSDSDEE